MRRNNLINFGRFVNSYLNTGHSVVDAGFNSCKIRSPRKVLSLWDSRIGTKDCSCHSKQGPEILLVSSIIASDRQIIDSSDFLEIHAKIDHLVSFHQFSAIIGLGIDSITSDNIQIDQLPESQQGFLNLLRLNEVSIGCRGLETLEFLTKNGFKRSHLFLTGCPSSQLIDETPWKILNNISKILVSGSLINHMEIMKWGNSHLEFLVIPQTLESYFNAVRLQKSNAAIEIFTPASYRSWVNKLSSWKPDVSVGTRFHGNMMALSQGIPAIFMSGDIRTREIATATGLPFFTDIVPLTTAIDRLESISMPDIVIRKSNFKSQIMACVSK
jgi:hypothetical protein